MFQTSSKFVVRSFKITPLKEKLGLFNFNRSLSLVFVHKKYMTHELILLICDKWSKSLEKQIQQLNKLFKNDTHSEVLFIEKFKFPQYYKISESSMQ